MKQEIAQLMIELARKLDPLAIEVVKEQPEHQPDLNVAVSTVRSIMSYINYDSETYDDITPAVLEFQCLSEKEKEISFFYLLGQYMELAKI